MGKVLNRETIRRIISECIERLNEGTNQQSLYHFSQSRYLPSILSSGTLKTDDSQKSTRNGKRFISFTRHRSAFEGYAVVAESNVRIEVDGTRLSGIHGVEIVPHEYYSPQRIEQRRNKATRRNISAKQRYADVLSSNLYFDRGTAEMYNQAEESVETSANAVDISRCVRRIDVLVNNEDDKHDCIKSAETGGELLKFVWVYHNPKDFNYQTDNCIPLVEFVKNGI